ncbi:unnamed protein product, partial [Effrenium voratum]
DQKLGLNLAAGPNIVCGDTGSDLPMVLATLRLMCGDKIVDRWAEQMKQADTEGTSEPQEADPASDAELDEAGKEEAERKVREEAEEEREAQLAASKLAVLFVVSPESYAKSAKVADKVMKLCKISGARCSMVPSPDVLVYTLARFAEEKSGVSVTWHLLEQHMENGNDKELEKDWSLPSIPQRDSMPELPEPSISSPNVQPKQAWVP